ncbi:MAG: antitoxin [Candidatus Limnocylindria bacterium]
MYSRRVQLLLDERRFQRIAGDARRRKVSVATVIREAIDAAASRSDDDARASAARDILAAPRMPVPDPEELRRELDDIRERVR